MISAVLFDLDGTLADTAPDLGFALNLLRTRRGLPELSMDEIRPQASHGVKGLFSIGFGLSPEEHGYAPLRDEFLEVYSANICYKTKLFPGISELLEKLEEMGLRWGVVTNKPHVYTVALLDALGLLNRSAVTVSGDTCVHAKPHPEPLFHAADALGIEARRCLYLGDDRRDVEASVAANMLPIVARYGYCGEVDIPGAAGGISHPLELLAYL